MREAITPLKGRGSASIRRALALAVTPLLAAGAAACGDAGSDTQGFGAASASGDPAPAEAGAGPFSNSVQAYVQDWTPATDSDAGPSVQRRADGDEVDEGTGGTTAAESSRVSGEMVGNFIVAIHSEEGFWVDIGRLAEVTIPLRSPSGIRPLAATEDIPPSTYDRVRVLLCHSSVDLEPGSRVGQRVLESKANVHITETGDVIVEREVTPFQIGPDSRVRLDIDLNTPGWLTEQAVSTGEASIPTLESEVRVAVANGTNRGE